MKMRQMKNKAVRILEMIFAELPENEFDVVLAAHLKRVALDKGASGKHIRFDRNTHARTGAPMLRMTACEMRDTDFAKALAEELITAARMRGVADRCIKHEIRDKPATEFIQPSTLHVHAKPHLPGA